MHTIERDLHSFGYGDVKFHIPTVKVLKKRFKGKNYYDEIPLLFNYGFFRVPRDGARNKEYLQRMKVAVGGIYNWVYRSEDSLPPSNWKREPYLVSIIKIKDIVKLKRISLLNSIYSSDDVEALGAGKFIVLHGYPFEGMSAEVLSVHPKKELVKVRLLNDMVNTAIFEEVNVHFSNIFYSIYSGCDEPTASDNTVEGLIEKSRVNKNSIYKDGTSAE